MKPEQRQEILDQLPSEFPIVEEDQDLEIASSAYESWASAIGHPKGQKGYCAVCGPGVVCPLQAFYYAVMASVVRELDRVGRLSAPGVTLIQKSTQSISEEVSRLVQRVVSSPEDTRGPVTWCEHGTDRHGPEAGCAECRCVDPKGHDRPQAWERLGGKP